jgi:hypothetical protein
MQDVTREAFEKARREVIRERVERLLAKEAAVEGNIARGYVHWAITQGHGVNFSLYCERAYQHARIAFTLAAIILDWRDNI